MIVYQAAPLIIDGGQEVGNYILIWTISDTDFFASTMIEDLTISADNESEFDAIVDNIASVQTTVDTIETNTISIYGDTSETNLDVKRILGLVHENLFIDNTVYDGFQNLIAARLRIYSVAGSVGTVNDVLATYEIDCNSDGQGKFIDWKHTRIS